MQQQTQQFNDGIVNIYEAENIANKGEMPKVGLALKEGSLRYEERTVGMSRFYSALQEKIKISQLIRVPRINKVSTQDVAILHDGTQYEIKQVQYPPNVKPECMDLSLERLETIYEIE
ncbi:MAG: hypothetical protein K0R15_630 [Clostridiales bacterium]|jgi:hypothetical protein|nr:hypothetical protein [Clostridiales bacterium]